MMKQIRTLTGLQMKNLYGINVFRHIKDKKVRNSKIALMVAYVILILMASGYVGGLVYGYTMLGLTEMIPPYLIMISSLIILFFAIFKAGSVIFQRNAYDILSSLPLSETAIVASRYIRMYVENLIITLVVMIPALGTYGWLNKPAISFYLIGLIVTCFIPCIPITIATFIGGLITAIASRVKHKSLVSTALSILLVVLVLVGTTGGSMTMTEMPEEEMLEMLQEMLPMVLGLIESIYPPAIWLGEAMLTGDVLLCLSCVAGGVLLMGLVIALVARFFHSISQKLYSTSASHDYQMERLQKESILRALFRREWKRYFASSVYVTNTIISPIMGLVFAISILAMGVSGAVDANQLMAEMGLPVELNLRGVAPFVLAATFCMMPTTCSSISLEGKEWWIVKSLPIRTKDLLDAKLLLNLVLFLPFLLVAEVLLAIALKPNWLELIWLIVIPVIILVCSAVFGLAANLKMPVFDWENEVTIVKQSASAFVGGIVGFLFVLICAVPVLLVPAAYAEWVKLAVCVLMVLVTGLLYQKNIRTDLKNL